MKPIAAALAVACIVMAGHSQLAAQPAPAVRVRAGLDSLASGAGDMAAFSVTYDDLHGLHGGVILTIFGTGRVEQKAVRVAAPETRQVSSADLQRLVALLRDLQAWDQKIPERAPIPDESRSRLTIRVAGAETTIWEWYNEMPKSARIIRIRDQMMEIARMPKPPR